MNKKHLKLSETDYSYLTSLIKKGQQSAKVFRRATALLELHHGKTYQSVAKTLKVTHLSVAKWRNRYLTQGLLCLEDKPRKGRPIEIDGRMRAKITALACTNAPEGRTRWTLRLLSEKVVELGICDNLSHTRARQILKKTNYNHI
jgi:putative transposase